MADELEQAIDDALAGDPRASAIAEMIGALRTRLAMYHGELATAPAEADRAEWDRRIRETTRQIAALEQDRVVAEFVEYSVRLAARSPRMDDDSDDEIHEAVS